MSEVKYRLIEGASVRQIGPSEFEVVEVHNVKNVGGTAAQRQYLALTDPGIPVYGALHPVVPQARVSSKDIQSLGADIAEVRVTYTPPSGGVRQLTPDDPPVWEISAGIETTESSRDKDDSLVELSYTYPTDYQIGGNPSALAGQTVVQTARFQFPQATFALRIRQGENRSPLDVSATAAANMGRTNSSTFLGQPAYTWLCTGINVANPRDVSPCEVAYELQYNPRTWRVQADFQDPFTGRVPDDVTEAGSVTVSPILEANFNSLPLI